MNMGGDDSAAPALGPAGNGGDFAAPAPAGGGMMSALGLNNPDRLRSVVAALGGGLKNVKNSPFPGEVFANAAGGGIEAGDKQEDTTYDQKLKALDRALKLQQIKQLGSYRDDMTDARFGRLNIDQQKADQTGVYQTGRLALGDRGVTVKEQLAPSQIARNNASADLATSRSDPNLPPEKRLTNADKATDTWYRDRVAPLRDELRAINQSAQSAEAKTQQYNKVQERLRDLDTERVNIKAQNRREHGLNEDGSDAMPKAKPGAAGRTGGTSITPSRPGKFAMGTRDDPHEPKTPADFAAIQPGQIFRDPGDGQLYEK